MAFASGRSSEVSSFKRYIGVGSFKVLAVNPTLEELSEIFPNRTNLKEPEYLFTTNAKDKSGNDREVKASTVSIYIQAEPEKNNGISAIFMARFVIANTPWYSVKNGITKAQIIDEYGRTTWATLADIEAKKIPIQSNNKPANISANYRYAYRGEAELTSFLINYLGIPNVQTYDRDKKVWNMVEHPENSEARLELSTLKNILSGKFDELRDIINLQPDNHVKMAIGVRSTDDGKLYQEVYTRTTMRNGAKTNDAIFKDISAAKTAGSLQSTDYFVLNESGNAILPDLQEYNPAPAAFTQVAVAQDSEETEDDGMQVDTSDDLPFGEE